MWGIQVLYETVKDNFNDEVFIIFYIALFGVNVNAGNLKVFGYEFCHSYDAGSCINFHYKKIAEATNFFGMLKYPEGKKAWDDCVKNVAGTDGDMAYCSMKFHYAEQDENMVPIICFHR
jgi:hypothetical protein